MHATKLARAKMRLPQIARTSFFMGAPSICCAALFDLEMRRPRGFSASILLRRQFGDPVAHASLQDIERRRAGGQHNVVEGAHVEIVAQFRLSFGA